MKDYKKTIQNIWNKSAVVIILIILWFIVTTFNFIDPIFLSTPQETLTKLFQLLFSGSLLPDLSMTIFRLFIGLVLGSFVGITLGLVIGYSKNVYEKFEFIIEFLRSTPTPVLFPLFLLFFGIGETAKILLVTWASFMLLIINTSYGVRHGKETRIITAKLFKANDFQIFSKIIFPGALPYIFSGLRIAVSHTLVVVIFVEMFIGTNVGLGIRILNAQYLFKTAEMYAIIIISSVLGYLLNKAVLSVENKILHWTKY